MSAPETVAFFAVVFSVRVVSWRIIGMWFRFLNEAAKERDGDVFASGLHFLRRAAALARSLMLPFAGNGM
jgi:hypothetical protein